MIVSLYLKIVISSVHPEKTEILKKTTISFIYLPYNNATKQRGFQNVSILLCN